MQTLAHPPETARGVKAKARECRRCDSRRLNLRHKYKAASATNAIDYE
ncbi:MAG: hypothetical protein KBT34_13255 [Prevotella sp.]|nr:hypothetical protein [Candidatus Prevotella equi]